MAANSVKSELQLYLQQINESPLLTAEEERDSLAASGKKTARSPANG